MVGVCPRGRMIATTGMPAFRRHAEGLIRSNNKQMEDRCADASIAMTRTTHPLIAPKLSRSETANEF